MFSEMPRSICQSVFLVLDSRTWLRVPYCELTAGRKEKGVIIFFTNLHYFSVLEGYTADELQWLSLYGGFVGVAVGVVMGMVALLSKQWRLRQAAKVQHNLARRNEFELDGAHEQRQLAQQAVGGREEHRVREQSRLVDQVCRSETGSLLRNPHYRALDSVITSTPKTREGVNVAALTQSLPKLSVVPRTKADLHDSSAPTTSRMSDRMVPAGTPGKSF